MLIVRQDLYINIFQGMFKIMKIYIPKLEVGVVIYFSFTFCYEIVSLFFLCSFKYRKLQK